MMKDTIKQNVKLQSSSLADTRKKQLNILYGLGHLSQDESSRPTEIYYIKFDEDCQKFNIIWNNFARANNLMKTYKISKTEYIDIDLITNIVNNQLPEIVKSLDINNSSVYQFLDDVNMIQELKFHKFDNNDGTPDMIISIGQFGIGHHNEVTISYITRPLRIKLKKVKRGGISKGYTKEDLSMKYSDDNAPHIRIFTDNVRQEYSGKVATVGNVVASLIIPDDLYKENK